MADTTLAVLWNGGSIDARSAPGREAANAAPATLLREPFAALGSDRPDLDASLVAHAVVGRLSDLLWQHQHADARRGRSPRRVHPRRGQSLTRSRSTVSVSRPAARMWPRARGGTSSHCE